ncbi:MAG: GNAT family N-acetyltransferase [Ferruginibacter sp.]
MMETSIDFKLIKASLKYKNVIHNLMQFYIYDFTEFNKSDVEENGLYADYINLDEYWKEPNHSYPYLIKKHKKHVGFVLVKFNESVERCFFSIAEFFILKKYRGEGIGKAVANQVFTLHKGQWEVHQIESNKPAQIFWNTVIDKYTRGQFNERLENGKIIQNFKN